MRTRPSARRRKTTVLDGPLPRLARLAWRLLVSVARGLFRLVRAAARSVAELRGARLGARVSVLALVANRRRAVLIERALRGAVRQHARAFDFELADRLLVVVRETVVDRLGKETAALERETRADGSTRWVITLAVWPSGAQLPLGPDALVAELSRQLLRLQRALEGCRATSLDSVSPLGEDAQWQPFEHGHRLHVVSATPGRDGHGTGPFDGGPSAA